VAPREHPAQRQQGLIQWGPKLPQSPAPFLSTLHQSEVTDGLFIGAPGLLSLESGLLSREKRSWVTWEKGEEGADEAGADRASHTSALPAWPVTPGAGGGDGERRGSWSQSSESRSGAPRECLSRCEC